MTKLEGVRACVFDAYGTLFDVHGPLRKLAAEIGEKSDDFSKLWRQKPSVLTVLDVGFSVVSRESVTATRLMMVFL